MAPLLSVEFVSCFQFCSFVFDNFYSFGKKDFILGFGEENLFGFVFFPVFFCVSVYSKYEFFSVQKR